MDVIVPFKGGPHQLDALIGKLADLRVATVDSITVVDNSREPNVTSAQRPGHIRLLAAPQRQSSYYARNRGAAGGEADWLLFLDADVTAPPELLDQYFASAPAPRTAVLAGGIIDREETRDGRRTAAARYAHLRRTLHVDRTLKEGFAYAKTANCAVRREAFDAVGGFPEDVRSGGDADLCLQLADHGWEMERRDDAAVVHWGRKGIWELLGQMARHGSGSQWLESRYPGFSPRKPLIRSCWYSVRGAGRAVALRLRGRRDDALLAWLDPLTLVAFEFGRLVPNRPWREVGPRRAVGRLRQWGRRGDKGRAELDFWRDRHRQEGGNLAAHPAWRYTTAFGLGEEFYAGKRVLDVGCGPRGSLEWADEAAERVGVDPLVPAYRELGIDDHKMRYVAAPAEALPFPDATFDIALTFNSLDHVDDVRAAVGELHRVLVREGTWLCVVEANAAPTATEPQTIPWDFFSTLPGWEVRDRRQLALDSDHDVYRSLERNLPWEAGPGLLVARLERREP